MSSTEQSAIDALVDEVIDGRDSAERAKAPKATTKAQAETVDEEPVDAEAPVAKKAKAKSKSKSKSAKSAKNKATIGFADPIDESNGSEPPTSLSGKTPDVDGDVAAITAERDSYLADSQRLAADFANYRKQSEKRIADTAASQSASLVRDLIPVLDACDAAIVQDADSAAGPIRSQLLAELTKNGLELLAPTEDTPFDPEQHEAVMHEAAPEDSEQDGPVVGEVLRAGYTWKGRVVRPAMVKVIG